MSAYLDRIAAEIPLARKDILGNSTLGRPLEALVFSTAPSPEQERFTVMVTASQHGAAEPAGGEALLVIARELAFGELRPLLDDIDIVLMPNTNPDGRDLNRRSNAKRVNINTDFVLLKQPETRTLKRALARYRPQAVLDSHESAIFKRHTLAREGYLTDFEAQFEIANNPAVPSAVYELMLTDLLPELLKVVTDGGLPAQRYLSEITSTRQAITNGGLTLRNFRNTAGLSGAVSFLLETKLDSREDTFPTYRNIAVRVDKQLLCLRTFLRLIHARRSDILAALARPAAVQFPLYARYVGNSESPVVSIPLRRIDTRELETVYFCDHRHVETADVITMPVAYVITTGTDRLRPLLDAHGIGYHATGGPLTLQVYARRFQRAAERNERLEPLTRGVVTLTAPAGSLIIDLVQPRGRLAVLLLDPRSTSSIFRYTEYATLLDRSKPHFVYPVFKAHVPSADVSRKVRAKVTLTSPQQLPEQVGVPFH